MEVIDRVEVHVLAVPSESCTIHPDVEVRGVDAGHALLYSVRQQRRQLRVRMRVSIAVAA